MTYKEKLLDPRWQKKRLECLRSDNFTCSWCGESTKTLHVHHFFYAKSGNPWDVEDWELATLCEDCHFIEHYKSFTPMERELITELQIMLSLSDKVLLTRINEIIIKHIKS